MLTLNGTTLAELPEERLYKDVRRRIEAAMETGNLDTARVTLQEYMAIEPRRGHEIRAYIVGAYGAGLC